MPGRPWPRLDRIAPCATWRSASSERYVRAAMLPGRHGGCKPKIAAAGRTIVPVDPGNRTSATKIALACRFRLQPPTEVGTL